MGVPQEGEVRVIERQREEQTREEERRQEHRERPTWTEDRRQAQEAEESEGGSEGGRQRGDGGATAVTAATATGNETWTDTNTACPAAGKSVTIRDITTPGDTAHGPLPSVSKRNTPANQDVRFAADVVGPLGEGSGWDREGRCGRQCFVSDAITGDLFFCGDDEATGESCRYKRAHSQTCTHSNRGGQHGV